MATTIDASTAGVGGIITTADNSGNLNIQSGGSTKIAVTSSGVAVTGLSKASLPTGSVLQVVQGTFSSTATTTTSTYVDTGLSASITPTSATSKVLAFVTMASVAKYGSNTGVTFRLLRGATSIIGFDSDAAYTNSTAYNSSGTSATNYLDSPATTSSTTYKVQFKSDQNSATVAIGDGGTASTSTLTLMEIAA
jgi:hypothetical protein